MTRDGATFFDADGKTVARARACERKRPLFSSTRVRTATSWRRKSSSSRKSSAIRWRITSIWRKAAFRCHSTLPFDPKVLCRAITIVACGTAYYAGLDRALLVRDRWPGSPVDIDVASEFRYREAPLPENGLMIVVSQSGETADTLASLRYAKSQGQHVLAVVNVSTSTIARESEIVAPTLAGPEIGVASTKAFTCQLAVLACLRARLRTSARRARCDEGSGRPSPN